MNIKSHATELLLVFSDPKDALKKIAAEKELESITRSLVEELIVLCYFIGHPAPLFERWAHWHDYWLAIHEFESSLKKARSFRQYEMAAARRWDFPKYLHEELLLMRVRLALRLAYVIQFCDPGRAQRLVLDVAKKFFSIQCGVSLTETL